MIVALQLVASAILWLGAVLCLPSLIRGRRRLLFWFLAVLAVTMTLQPLPVYDVVDATIGGVNTTFFLFHATAIVGVALLNSLVQTATTAEDVTRARARSTIIATTVIILAQAVLFFGSDWRLTSDVHAMIFDRWDYALYASTTWFALAYFSVSVMTACLADLRRQRRAVTRISLALVSLGCLAVLVFAAVSVWSAISSAADPDSTFTESSLWLYRIALIGAPICVGIGLVLTTAVDGLTRIRRTTRDRVLLWRITPLWERLIRDSPELSIESSMPRLGLLLVPHPGTRLYRRYVEVRDSLLLHPRAATPAELALLGAIEHHDRLGPPDMLSPLSATPQRGPRP